MNTIELATLTIIELKSTAQAKGIDVVVGDKRSKATWILAIECWQIDRVEVNPVIDLPNYQPIESQFELTIEPESIVNSNCELVTCNTSERQWRSNTHLRPQSIRVGRNFMLSDFLYSETAVKKGIANVPPTLNGMEVESIKKLCEHILDPVVDRFGAISITYGYVSDALQKATYPAWKPSIHNCKPCNGADLGAACDFQPHNTEFSHRDILLWISASCEYDRLIMYPGSTIVCVAWSDKPRSHCRQWVYPDEVSRAVYKTLPKTAL